jgi:hypothetical protein
MISIGAGCILAHDRASCFAAPPHVAAVHITRDLARARVAARNRGREAAEQGSMQRAEPGARQRLQLRFRPLSSGVALRETSSIAPRAQARAEGPPTRRVRHRGREHSDQATDDLVVRRSESSRQRNDRHVGRRGCIDRHEPASLTSAWAFGSSCEASRFALSRTSSASTYASSAIASLHSVRLVALHGNHFDTYASRSSRKHHPARVMSTFGVGATRDLVCGNRQ